MPPEWGRRNHNHSKPGNSGCAVCMLALSNPHCIPVRWSHRSPFWSEEIRSSDIDCLRFHSLSALDLSLKSRPGRLDRPCSSYLCYDPASIPSPGENKNGQGAFAPLETPTASAGQICTGESMLLCTVGPCKPSPTHRRGTGSIHKHTDFLHVLALLLVTDLWERLRRKKKAVPNKDKEILKKSLTCLCCSWRLHLAHLDCP